MAKESTFQPNPIARAIIDSTVDRSLREIEEDPKRSVRKLTDLGRLFVKGRFTDEIYGMVQDLLHNDDSPYYTAIERLLRYTEQQHLKDFGINLGYNGLNIGGKNIQHHANQRSFHTPWLISLRINASIPNSLSVQEIENCITQARPLGIYCFAIRLEGSLLPLKPLTEVMTRNKDCAFFFLLPDQKLLPAHIDCLAQCPATLFFLRNESTFSTNRDALRARKILFGISSLYDDKNTEAWISGHRIQELASYETPFLILLPDDTCSNKNMMRMAKYCRQSRMHPEYPLFLFDAVGDVIAIDRLNSVSEAGHFFEILETGDLRTEKEVLTDFRHTVSLEQLLTIALPTKSRKPGHSGSE